MTSIHLTPDDLKAPMPWFGGKARAASMVWERLGDVQNYVEPFAGSAIVLLKRPGWREGTRWTETVNDADLLLTNFWRAVRADPDGVARHCDYPVSEVDLTARHRWLVQEARPRLRDLRLDRDPDAHDVKAAGWWVWGISQWIGSGWCPDVAPEFERGGMDRAAGLWEQMPDIRGWAPGKGIHQNLDRIPGVSEQMPGIGANTPGRGVHQATLNGGALALLRALSARLRWVRICHGDWARVCSNTALDVGGRVLTGVFLDPPYAAFEHLYSGAAAVSEQARAWCAEHGDNPKRRIALCGYAGEHDALEPLGWTPVRWKAGGGYSNAGAAAAAENNAHRETIWFSPHCLAPARQLDLLGDR